MWTVSPSAVTEEMVELPKFTRTFAPEAVSVVRMESFSKSPEFPSEELRFTGASMRTMEMGEVATTFSELPRNSVVSESVDVFRTAGRATVRMTRAAAAAPKAGVAKKD